MDYELRDAVIKLESEVKHMSGALSSMAESVKLLADVRLEVSSIKQESVSKYISLEKDISKLQKDVNSLGTEVRTLADDVRAASNFTNNASKIGWGFITVATGIIVTAIWHNLKG